MKIHYIILAHRDADQVHRLIRRLSNSESYFYVHVDKNTALSSFQNALKQEQQVTLLSDEQREYCSWGGNGIVRGTLTCLKLILQEHNSGYCILLSGQDYPLKSNVEINQFFQKKDGVNFIEGIRFPHPGWNNGGFDRLLNYHYQPSGKKYNVIDIPSIWDQNFFRNLTKNLIKVKILIKHRIIPFQILKKRTLPKNMHPYGGSAWWAIPFSSIKIITDYMDMHPTLIKFYDHVHISDEEIFATLVYNLFPINSIQNTLTFTHWIKGASSPINFKKEHFNMLTSQKGNFLFARKFIENEDPEILDMLDEYLIAKSQKKSD